jgi:acyl-CoA dehydrogenase
MGLLTPVIKGALTELGFANTVLAQQIFGGHGYIAEHGMEQFVRDARISMIYEGANGIQALDLVGRKLLKDGGRALQAFFSEVSGYINERKSDETMLPFTVPLESALSDLQQASIWFAQNALGKPDNAGAGATDYMQMFGMVALGYMWCLIVDAAKSKTSGNGTRANDKLVLARFFMERMLPATATHLARIKAGADSTMALPIESF